MCWLRISETTPVTRTALMPLSGTRAAAVVQRPTLKSGTRPLFLPLVTIFRGIVLPCKDQVSSLMVTRTTSGYQLIPCKVLNSSLTFTWTSSCTNKRVAMVVWGDLTLMWCRRISLVHFCGRIHYDDVIMSTMASLVTSITIVNSTVYSGADERKHQSAASLAFVREFTSDRWIPRTKGQ